MELTKKHSALDLGLCVLSGLSVLATISVLVGLESSSRAGPEPSGEEVWMMLSFVAHLVAFGILLVGGIVRAGFYGSLRMSRSAAGMLLAALLGFVVQILAANASS